MAYDWRGTSPFAPGTRDWFREVDQRFLSAAYFATGEDGRPFGRFLRREIAADKAVLEVGCGMGTHAALLAEAGAHLTAIDLTAPAVELTRRRLALNGVKATVGQADAEDLPFEDASFDTVWSWGVIHHSDSTERCLAEITRVLKPGGHLLLMVYHRRSLFYYLHCGFVRGVLLGQLRKRSLADIYNDNIDGAYARLFTRKELRRLLAPVYRNVRIITVGEKSELLPIPRSRLKNRLQQAIPDQLASAILSLWGFLLVVEATRA